MWNTPTLQRTNDGIGHEGKEADSRIGWECAQCLGHLGAVEQAAHLLSYYLNFDIFPGK